MKLFAQGVKWLDLRVRKIDLQFYENRLETGKDRYRETD